MKNLVHTILILGMTLSDFAFSEMVGRVFLSETGAGIPNVAVSNGRDLVLTDINGRYKLPEHGAFVYLTRRDGVDPVEWFKSVDADSLDFEISEQIKTPEASFFIQMSDTHVYDRKSDFLAFSSPAIPWFIPDFLVPWITMNILEKSYGDDIADKLRSALSENGYTGDLAGLSASEVYSVYRDEQSAEQSIFEPLDEQIGNAIDEVVGFAPDFVINTGDLVLESNNGSPEAIDRWFKYYLKLTKELPVRIYNTIGNNEIAGTERKEFLPSDPRYGKFFFRSYLGPTHFSFDKGNFHFVALDTHSPDPQEENPDYWNFGKMTPDIQVWFENDLEAHKDKTLVVLNHEPFHFDELWPFENDQHVDDDGLFSQFGVDYVLTGHTHYKSAMKIAGVQHLTAGALSGMRWILPASVHERGYRLFRSRKSELFSAWKETGKPLIALAEPQPQGGKEIVIAAVDEKAAFRDVKFYDGERELTVNPLSEYFFVLAVEQIQSQEIKVVAISGNGDTIVVMLETAER